jgi:hypothetical protein
MKILCICTYKGTHARDFHSHSFYTYFCIFQTLIDTKRSTINIFKKLLQTRPDIRNFLSLPDFAESAKHN